MQRDHFQQTDSAAKALSMSFTTCSQRAHRSQGRGALTKMHKLKHKPGGMMQDAVLVNNSS